MSLIGTHQRGRHGDRERVRGTSARAAPPVSGPGLQERERDRQSHLRRDVLERQPDELPYPRGLRGGSDPLVRSRAGEGVLVFEDMQWANANSNQGNVLRSNSFGNGTDCAVRMNSVSSVDPDSNTGNMLVGNRYRLRTVVSQGFCGTGAAKRLQNTLVDNLLIPIPATGNPPSGPPEPVDGAWLLSDSKCDDRELNSQRSIAARSSISLRVTRVSSDRVGLRRAGRVRADRLRQRAARQRERPPSRRASSATGRSPDLCFYIDDPALNGSRDTLVAVSNEPICRLVEQCSVTGSVVPRGLASRHRGEPRGAPSAAARIATRVFRRRSSRASGRRFRADNRCSVKVQPTAPNPSLSIRARQISPSQTAP